jgi:uncharacterized protein YjbI with pentapeptide repeats
MVLFDLTDSKRPGAVLKSVDLKGTILTGAIFDEADLSGALMVNATFNSYTTPAKKAAAGQGAQLGRAVAKAVGKGLWAEFRGGDSEDEGGGSQEEEDIVEEGQSMIDGDDLAYALDQVRQLLGISSYRRFKRFATFSGSLSTVSTPEGPLVNQACQVVATAAAGLEQLVRVRVALLQEFDKVVVEAGASVGDLD